MPMPLKLVADARHPPTGVSPKSAVRHFGVPEGAQAQSSHSVQDQVTTEVGAPPHCGRRSQREGRRRARRDKGAGKKKARQARRCISRPAAGRGKSAHGAATASCCAAPPHAAAAAARRCPRPSPAACRQASVPKGCCCCCRLSAAPRAPQPRWAGGGVGVGALKQHGFGHRSA